MKNFIKIILLTVLLCVYWGCADSNNNNSNGEAGSVETTELKMALYNKLLGTWELKEGQYTVDDYTDTYFSIIFASDSITLDGVRYEIHLSEDLFLETEIPEEKIMDGTLYIDIDGLHFITFDTGVTNVSLIEVGRIYYEELNSEWNARVDDFVKISGGNDESGEELDFSVVGDWSYTIAAGNTQTTFSIKDDGTFSFTKNSNVTNGTYSLSGNEITFEFDQNASMNIKDTFTISGSEDAITLTLVESVSTVNGNTQPPSTTLSNMLNAFYGIVTSTSVTLSK